MRFVALLVIVSIAVMISVTNGKPAKTPIEIPADQPCEVEGKATKSYRLEIITTYQVQAATQKLCEGKGGRLMQKTLSNNNKAVNHDEIMEQIRKDGDKVTFYIGISDAQTEGEWITIGEQKAVTLDGTTSLQWRTDFPTTNTVKNCAVIDYKDRAVIHTSCSGGLKGVCEIEQ